jgi:acetyltransferase-like isoleucine patch superfamily enzyme
MTDDEQRRLPLLRVAGGIFLSVYKAILYFLSFLGPAILLRHFRALPAAALLALAIAGFGVAGVVFLLLLVVTRRFLIGDFMISGHDTIHTANGKKWFSAAMLTSILDSSSFRSMTGGLSLFAPWYYRGMGAKLPNSVLIGSRALIFDPWFVEMGENVTIGADAIILGHIGYGRELVLGRVVIGEGALIGLRSVIFPDVLIGSHARVAAGAVVMRGTIIPDGETWAGVPARKISSLQAVLPGHRL